MYCKRCSLYKKTGNGHVENRHQEIAALCFNEKTLGNLISCIPILINKLANPVSSGGGAGYGDVPVPESWITAEPKTQQSHSRRKHCHNRQKLPSSLPQRTQQTKPQAMSERDRLLLFQHSYSPSRITKQGGIHQKVLTGYFQRGVSANGLS